MPQEPSFQLENLEYSAKLGLWVLVAAHDVTTTNLPVGGTTTLTATGASGLKLPTGGRPDASYDGYIYTHLSPAATAGYFRLNFVDVFPTTPLVTQGIDPVWGVTRTHSYLALTASELPDRATEYPASSGRYVLSATESHLSGNVCIVNVVTVGSLTAVQTDKPVDDETGDTQTLTRTFTLAASAPAGSSIASNGQFTTVEQQSYRLWVSTQRILSRMPILSGSGLTSLTGAKSITMKGAVYWPPVLMAYEFKDFVQMPSASNPYLRKKWIPSIRDGYSHEVKMIRKMWLQATEPTVAERPEINESELITSRIDIEGNRLQIHEAACLHPEVVYVEEVYLRESGPSTAYNSTAHKALTYRVGATPLVEWPATQKRFKSELVFGMWRCTLDTYYQPTVVLNGGTPSAVTAGLLTLSEATWTGTDYGYYAPGELT